MGQHAGQEARVVPHPQQHGFLQGAQQPPAGLFAVPAVGDDLGQQRVVIGADFQALGQSVVHPEARALGRQPGQHPP